MKPDITMFFPAYNEEKNLPILINSARKVLKQVTNNYEIMIVAYEGSTDSTIKLVKDYAKKDKNIKLVVQPKDQKGMGIALRLGFKNAKYPFVFYADSDNQFKLEEFKKFLQHIKDYDIIAGYRIKRQDPFTRILTAKVYNIIVSILFGTRERDLDCAFRLVNKKVFKKIQLKCKTGLGTTELLAKARKNKFRIKEIGVNHYSRTAGQPIFEGKFLNFPKPKVVVDLLKEMIQLKKDMKNGSN